jgi:hypothetical protein
MKLNNFRSHFPSEKLFPIGKYSKKNSTSNSLFTLVPRHLREQNRYSGDKCAIFLLYWNWKYSSNDLGCYDGAGEGEHEEDGEEQVAILL